jgi:multiple sugar transport system ATP-binding protein
MSLAFRGVGKTFVSLRGRVVAVRDVSLSIGDGELFVLLGPSGFGKSTLLNLAAGLERPTSGEILLDGRIVAGGAKGGFVPPGERNVAMVFQSYALYPHLTVFENIAFPLRVARAGRGEVEEAVARAAGMLEIRELLGSRPAELSGGQRQRVAIARAIVRRPRLFLLDEPLSNLDAALRAATRAELKGLLREVGVTTLYVTHDQTEAMTLGDRVALLRAGRVVQLGAPDELYAYPASPFAASFVGQVPMNLLRAQVREESGHDLLLLGRQSLTLSPDEVPRVRSLNATRILLGIRPEHVRIVGEGTPGTIAGTVTLTENLGRELLLHVRMDEQTVRVLTADRKLGEGDSVALAILPEHRRFYGENEEV